MDTRNSISNRRARVSPAGRVCGATSSLDAAIQAIGALLDSLGVPVDARAEVLGGAFVTEAVRPYWLAGSDAAESHARMRDHDPELAEAVEAISPMLLGRAQARADGVEVVRAIEEFFRANPAS